MATPDFHVVVSTLYRARPKSCWFTLDGALLVIPALTARLLANSLVKWWFGPL